MSLDGILAAIGAEADAHVERIEAEARRVLDAFGPSLRSDGRHGGHVFNLGHGISQFTSPEAVQTLVDAVHQYSRKLRS